VAQARRIVRRQSGGAEQIRANTQVAYTVSPDVSSADSGETQSRRRPGWRSAALKASDLQCASCGYDEQLAE
jgi:hypothetical protein